VNTVKASFNTIMEQMTEIRQRKKKPKLSVSSQPCLAL